MYKLSLVIPIYNVEMYIEECINSVITQLSPEIEVICVNDGTPDKSMELVKSIIQSLPLKKRNQFIFIDQENGGLSNARNTGINNSSGSYVAFLDSDDTLRPDYFKTVIGVLEENTTTDILDFNLITSESRILKSSNGSLRSAFNYMNWYVPARIIKRKLLQRFSFTENILYEDLDLMPEIYLASNKIIHIDKPLYYYRTNQSSITRAINLINNTKSIKSLEFILAKFINLYNDTYNSYYGMLIIQCYFMLTIQSYKRVSASMALRSIDVHHKSIKKILEYNTLPIDYSIINKRILLFFLFPKIYLRLYSMYISQNEK